MNLNLIYNQDIKLFDLLSTDKTILYLKDIIN